jgi:hypothetical protein
MIARRALLVTPFALSARAARAGVGEPPDGRLSFSVLRKGSPIGTHTITFRRSGNVLEVRVDVQMAVGIGPITLFRYRHNGVEVWRDDRFAEIQTATDNDGEQVHFTARPGPGGVVAESNVLGRAILPAEALPLTHWNIRTMSTPVFSPQDGKAMQFTVKPLGATRVVLASGANVPATRFSLTGEGTLDEWYDDQNVWAGLRLVAKDGSVIEYRRMA